MELPYVSAIPLLDICTPKGVENRCSYKNLYTNVHSNIIHNSHKVEVIQIFNNWQMYKYNVVFYGITIQYAYNGILLFHSININGILFSNEDAEDFVWITTNWKILKDMGIPDHLTCLLWSLYVGKEATVRTRHRTMDWFKLRKGECQSYILSPCLFNLYAE